ncbi:hypothetical protein ABK040_003710 [Willaertia magna]
MTRSKKLVDFSTSSSPVWILGVMYQPFLIFSDDNNNTNSPNNNNNTNNSNSNNNNNQRNHSSSSDKKPKKSSTSSSSSYKLFGGGKSKNNHSEKHSPNNNKTNKSSNKKQTSFSDDDLIKIYHNKLQFESFLLDFESKFWFTYRKDFEPIENSSLPIETFNNNNNYFNNNNSNNYNSTSAASSAVSSYNNNGSSISGNNYLNSQQELLLEQDNSPTTPSSYYIPFNNNQQYSSSPNSKNNNNSSSSSSLSRLYRSLMSYTSDSGWGCMMRTGQMMLGHAFVTHYLGRSFRLPVAERNRNMYDIILNWFYDEDLRPYSIHRITRAGKLFGKKIGEWFGPSTISYVIKILVEQHLQGEFVVHVADQGGIYTDEIISKCEYEVDEFIPVSSSSNNNNNNLQRFEHTPQQNLLVNNNENQNNNGNYNANESNLYPSLVYPKTVIVKKWKPLIIIIPLRLGLETFNSSYIPSLLKVFEIPQSLGIMGGKPKSSLYFVGHQDDYVIYLDPHTTQKVSTNTETYHCKEPLKMHASKIDPSMALGFLCSTRQDFEEFSKLAHQYLSQTSYPLVTIRKEKPNTNFEHDVMSDFDVSDDETAHNKKQNLEEEEDIVFV